jgi:phosphoribosylanthranilate isomerase
MFRIKICGVTNVADAEGVVAAGADAIGLNFYEKSPRMATEANAQAIAAAVGDRCANRVGVFVNHSLGEIIRIVELAELTWIQFHGDEPPQALAAFGPFLAKWPLTGQARTVRPQIIRARRFDDRGVAAIAEDVSACARIGCSPAAVLVDAYSPGRYGGTGETVSWLGLADHRRWLGKTPLILAGGLTPDNVAEAIRIVRPAAVDVASGVESAPGKKDPTKVRDFVAAAQGAFEAIESKHGEGPS